MPSRFEAAGVTSPTTGSIKGSPEVDIDGGIDIEIGNDQVLKRNDGGGGRCLVIDHAQDTVKRRAGACVECVKSTVMATIASR